MAHDWKQTRLAEVCNFQNGFAFKNSDYVEEGNGAFEIFRMGHILRGGGFNPDGKKALVPQEQAQKLGRFLLNEGDILMCMTDMKSSMALLGHTARMPVSGRYLVNQRVGRITVKKPDVLDQRFLYYYSNSPDYIDWLRSHANSGVQVNLSTEAILNSPVSFPPLPVQRRIAGILSAYDELMENSQRRIRLLEAMARALYREWFVHFRFPGHEKHPRVASPLGDIPQGWEVKTVEEIVKRIPVGKKYDQKTVNPTGAVPVFDQGKTAIIGYHDDEPGVAASESSPVVVFANHTCYQRLIHFPVSAIQNVLPFVPSPSIPRNIYWLHWATNGLVVFNDYKGHWPELAAKALVVPSADLCQRFGDFTAPLSRRILKLERANENLRRTRDLLLPRLLSGQVNLTTN